MADGRRVDVALAGGRIVDVSPTGSVPTRAGASLACGGRLIEQVAASGTGARRTPIDIDTELGLSGLEAMLRLKQRYRALVDIEVVAFPQSGILRDPGTADLLDKAVAAGADLVGGLDPAGIDGDVGGHLDAVFAIAGRRGVGVDRGPAPC